MGIPARRRKKELFSCSLCRIFEFDMERIALLGCGIARCSKFASSSRRLSTVTLSSVQQSIAGRTRFYKFVGVEAVEAPPGSKQQGTMYKVTLDNRNLRTPAGNALLLPSLPLALAIAAEWDAQAANHPKGIQPATMPMMILASTAIDQILPDHGLQVKNIVSLISPVIHIPNPTLTIGYR